MAVMRDMTIKRRVFFVVMATSLASVIVASLMSMAFSARYRMAVLQKNLQSLAEMVSDNCLVSLTYNVPEDASKLLSSLTIRPSLAHAVIYDDSGADFAHYSRDDSVYVNLHVPSDAPVVAGSVVQDGYLQVWCPVVFEGKRIGVLYLFDDMSAVRESVKSDIVIFSIVVLVVVAVAYAMIIGLHSLICNPLGYLSGVATQISAAGDYSVRAERKTGGEIGALVDSFNDMLSHIERTNTRLESLVGELEDKNIELERFAYTVSHDLKSPLITIKGFVGQLRKHLGAEDFDRVNRDIGRVEGAADKMLDLLKDLLELSRVGRIVGDTKQVRFNDIVKDSLSQLADMMRENSVEVTVADDMPVVSVDALRLTEVMQNLLENAVKFMGDQSTPRISIGCRNEDGKNIFFVSDNGMGIEADYREKVFGLFEQLNQHIAGTGIGLTIVRRIVEIHGGTIWIEDVEEGGGAAFCFTLESTDNNNTRENTNAG